MLRRSEPWEDKIETEGIANAKFLRQEWGQHVLKKQKESHCSWNVVKKSKSGKRDCRGSSQGPGHVGPSHSFYSEDSVIPSLLS